MRRSGAGTPSTSPAPIRLGAVSAREVAEDALARLAAANPAINAVVLPLEREALEAADAVDAARARGEALPPLAGVPVTTKINADQRGLPTSNGVVAFRDVIAAEDSPVVANLRRAGAVVIGRTNTPAFSWRWFTDNALHGRTLNPWDAGVTPGGSSGGAAAAVAAGIGAVAHGNDIGGSVRYPAYACGVAGLRPSAGRIPAFNPSAAAERSLSAQILSTQGPLARRVGDLRLALAAMAAPDPRDPWQMPVPLAGPPPARGRSGSRSAPIPPGAACILRCRRRWRARARRWRRRATRWRRLRRRIGTRWRPTGIPSSTPRRRSSCAQAFERHADASAGAIFARMATRPLPAIEDYMRLLARRATHQRAWALWMAERGRCCVVPSSNEPPFPQGLDETDFDRVFRAQSPLFPTVLLGLPSVSVPTGVVDGLPTGVQVVAPRWREDLALDAAEAIEAAWPMPTPVDPRG